MHWDCYHGDIGCPSFTDYVEETLGIAEGRARTLLRLDRKLHQRPALRDAYRNGKLGWNKAWLVVKATHHYPDRAEAWVEHARRVTFRRLDMEVRVVTALREISHHRWWAVTHGLPPDSGMLRELRMLPGAYRPPDSDALERLAGQNADVRTPEWPRKPHILLNQASSIVLRAPPDVFTFYRTVVSGMKKLFGPTHGIVGEERCLVTMLAHFAETYSGKYRRALRRIRIYERDAGRCMFPGCGSRVIQDHHLRLRSLGGGDAVAELIRRLKSDSNERRTQAWFECGPLGATAIPPLVALWGEADAWRFNGPHGTRCFGLSTFHPAPKLVNPESAC